jgi:hypothetical protein
MVPGMGPLPDQGGSPKGDPRQSGCWLPRALRITGPRSKIFSVDDMHV